MFKYAVIVERSVYIPGDERSRTNPGHGYPATTEYFQNVITFDTEQQLKAWIIRHNNTDAFKAIKYQELQVNIDLDVTLK